MNALSDEPLRSSDRCSRRQQHQLLACPSLAQRPSRAAAYRSRRADAGPREAQPCLERANPEWSDLEVGSHQSQGWAGRALALQTGPSLVRRRRVRVGTTRGGVEVAASCITLSTQQNSEANMARLAVALALAAGAQAFMAPVTTQPAKTVVYGKGGELRDRKDQCGYCITLLPLAARCTGRWSKQQALQPSSRLRKRYAKKRPLRDKLAPRRDLRRRLKKKKSRARGITPRRVAAPPKRTGAPRRPRPRRRANK